MAFKMYGKSPMMKALIGGQTILEEKAPELAAAIKASPSKMAHGKSPKKNYMTMGKYSKSGDAVKFGDSPKKMYGKSPKKFASDAERKAAYASGYKGKKKK